MVSEFINFLNNTDAMILWVALLIICFSSVLIFYKLFGKSGLYVYIAIAIIAANLQVLKAVIFPFKDTPIPLGTLLFATGYLCTDILSEYHGKKYAIKGVYIGFLSYFFWTVIMIITIGFTPLTAESAPADMLWNVPFHGAMEILFSPSVNFFIAGMVAYLISQLNDIWLFSFLKKKTNGSMLWLRNNISTALSAFVDSIIFSVLAWIVLAENPLPFGTVLFTITFGTYIMRIFIALLDTPFIYLAGKFNKNNNNDK